MSLDAGLVVERDRCPEHPLGHPERRCDLTAGHYGAHIHDAGAGIWGWPGRDAPTTEEET